MEYRVSNYHGNKWWYPFFVVNHQCVTKSTNIPWCLMEHRTSRIHQSIHKLPCSEIRGFNSIHDYQRYQKQSMYGVYRSILSHVYNCLWLIPSAEFSKCSVDWCTKRTTKYKTRKRIVYTKVLHHYQYLAQYIIIVFIGHLWPNTTKGTSCLLGENWDFCFI